MNKQKMIDAGIDYDGGTARLMGNTEMYEKFLQMFISDDSFQQLDAAMEAKNYAAAFSAAHTLKGVAGNLSMQTFYDVLVPFVDMLRNNADIPGAVENYPELKKKYEQIIEALNAQ